jgi:hypothetical protein
MSYYFIENRYPSRDPNIDLDFENDILYSALMGDELDKHAIPYVNTENVVPLKKNKKKIKIQNNKKYDNSKNIYLLFIFLAIFLILIWHYYGKNTQKNSPTIDTNIIEPELVMLSPEIGNEIRYFPVKNY